MANKNINTSLEEKIRLGSKIEMERVRRGMSAAAAKGASEEDMIIRMTSSVHEIVDDDTLLITNPTSGGRLIPLHPGEHYDCYFHVGDRILAAKTEVDGKDSDGNIRLVRIRLVSPLTKHERRKYFRLNISMPIKFLELTADNSADFKQAIKTNSLLKMPGFLSAQTINISGGGMKFHSKEEIKPGAIILVNLNTVTDENKIKPFIFLGKVLETYTNPNDRKSFIHRIMYIDVSPEAREDFVRFIFLKERENLKQRGSMK